MLLHLQEVKKEINTDLEVFLSILCLSSPKPFYTRIGVFSKKVELLELLQLKMKALRRTVCGLL